MANMRCEVQLKVEKSRRQVQSRRSTRIVIIYHGDGHEIYKNVRL